ncbi:MAG: nucleotidase, partial [Candidatus Thermoplasmatota archaeon]|nr:nucleotidase [Candidatus Thermoplasmatota archaeon]
LDEIAKMCEGFSGAEIKNTCTEAGMFTVRAGGKKVTMAHFIQAVKKVQKKRDGEDRKVLDSEKSKIYL